MLINEILPTLPFCIAVCALCGNNCHSIAQIWLHLRAAIGGDSETAAACNFHLCRPIKLHLLVATQKRSNLRLISVEFNVSTGPCTAVYRIATGHRNEIISI